MYFCTYTATKRRKQKYLVCIRSLQCIYIIAWIGRRAHEISENYSIICRWRAVCVHVLYDAVYWFFFLRWVNLFHNTSFFFISYMPVLSLFMLQCSDPNTMQTHIRTQWIAASMPFSTKHRALHVCCYCTLTLSIYVSLALSFSGTSVPLHSVHRQSEFAKLFRIKIQGVFFRLL